MTIHEIDVSINYYNSILKKKLFLELRKNNNYKINDFIMFKEWNPHKKTYLFDDTICSNYTGKKIVKKIINVELVNSKINNTKLEDYVVLTLTEIDSDIELKWHDRMNEWGNIFCPFLSKSVMTYYPNGTTPYDTVTNLFLSEDGDIYYYKYDHDYGWWDDATWSYCDSNEYFNLNEIFD